MELQDLTRIHCVGLGGVGVSAIARFFLSHGVRVSGSDGVYNQDFALLEEKGVEIFIGHDPSHVTKKVECVVYSPAVPDSNPELQKAHELGIPVKSYPEMLGELSREKMTIAVSGTNGKTTTTALLGRFLEQGGVDPTVIVGGKVAEWGGNFRLGGGDVLVAEACEYKRAMLQLSPRTIVLTNIEADHLDYYRDIEDIIDAFSEYVSRLTEDDILIYNIDDERVREVSSNTLARALPFGCSNKAGVRAKDIIVENGRQHFTLEIYGEDVGELSTILPGEFNIYNILAAATVAMDMGVTIEHIQEALDTFKGSWRRFEVVGVCEETMIISDYAHHPTAIQSTLKAARGYYPDRRILAIFQPHHEDRTIKLFDDFVESFVEADEVLLSEIYHVAGREEKTSKISSKDLARAIEERGGVDRVSFAHDLDATEKSVKKRIKDFDIVLFMGAGNIDVVARRLAGKI